MRTKMPWGIFIVRVPEFVGETANSGCVSHAQAQGDGVTVRLPGCFDPAVVPEDAVAAPFRNVD